MDSMTVMGFPRVSNTPGEMCTAELDFPQASFLLGESCADERYYKVDFVGRIASVCVDSD